VPAATRIARGTELHWPECATVINQEDVTMPVKAIPTGYHSITPYLIIDGATAAIDFYKKAFGATELFRMPDESGKRIRHAELKIGDSPIMLADEFPEMGYRNPKALGGTPVSLMLYVEDVDKVIPRAVTNGAKIVQPIKDQFYGDRSGTIHDPFGHVWTVATHIKDVSPDEMMAHMSGAAK
jgi:PhnB protein